MTMKTFGCFMMTMMLGLATLAGEVTVTGVKAWQRYPWNGKVDIVVTLSGASNDVAQAECTFVATNSATHEALSVVHVIGLDGATGNDSTWRRWFVWDATADVGEVKIAGVALTVEANLLGGVQLWEKGPYWAECNVGATKPEDYGYYFWWGDTVGYTRSGGTWTNDSYYDGVAWKSSTETLMSVDDSPFSSGICPTYNKTISQLQSAGHIDSTGNLVETYDAATAHLGAPWRMPTDVEFAALICRCTTTWTTRNGVYGRLVTGKGAYSSKSIFLPAAGHGHVSSLYELGSYGYYWSSTLYPGSSDYAWRLNFGSSSFSYYSGLRNSGFSIRPLRESFGNGQGTVFDVTVMGGTGSGSYARGTIVTVTANAPETGFKFAGWTGTARAYLSNTRIATTTLVVPAEDVSLTATYTKGDEESGFRGVQLWENGPYWAECNVGATKPEEYGYYFWWGDTVGYTIFVNDANSDTYAWCVSSMGTRITRYEDFPFISSNCLTCTKTSFQLQSAGYINSKGDLVAAHDAATAHLGAPWRMPTIAELAMLDINCTTRWTTRNGVHGQLVTGKGSYSSKSIFLPAGGYGWGRKELIFNRASTGYYWSSSSIPWSSSPLLDKPSTANLLLIENLSFDLVGCVREHGCLIRPLREFDK